jgi:hypothetical protein
MAPRILKTLERQLEEPGPGSVIVDYAADALIRLGSTTPASVAQKLYPLRPEAALILLRQAGSEADEFLFTLLERERSTPWLVAANLLHRHNSPGFAARLLHDLQITANVIVNDPDRFMSIGLSFGGSAVGDSFSITHASLPPKPRYRLYKGEGHLLVSGPIPIYYERSVQRPGTQTIVGTLFDNSIPSAEVKLQYLAVVASSAVELRDQEQHYVEWRGRAGYVAELSKIRESLQARYAALIKALTDNGKLTPAEAAAVRTLQVNLVVTDQRSRQSPPLPPLP